MSALDNSQKSTAVNERDAQYPLTSQTNARGGRKQECVGAQRPAAAEKHRHLTHTAPATTKRSAQQHRAPRRASGYTGAGCTNHELLQRGGEICVHPVRVGLLNALAEALLEGLHGLAKEGERDAALRIAVRHAQIFELLLADEVEHVPAMHTSKQASQPAGERDGRGEQTRDLQSRRRDRTNNHTPCAREEDESHALVIDEGRFPVRCWEPREQLVGDGGKVTSDLAALLVQGLLDEDDGVARNHTVDDVALLCGDTCKRRPKQQ
jgi:hypothetical protein